MSQCGSPGFGSVLVLVIGSFGEGSLVKRPRFEDGFEIQKLPIEKNKTKQDHLKNELKYCKSKE